MTEPTLVQLGDEPASRVERRGVFQLGGGVASWLVDSYGVERPYAREGDRLFFPRRSGWALEELAPGVLRAPVEHEDRAWR